MAAILILYSTVDGQTLTICKRIQHRLEQTGNTVALQPVDEFEAIDLDRFDKLVLGASIRYGKHRPQVFRFVEARRQVLDSKPSAFFTVNIVARKPTRNTPETNPYLRKFLKQTGWEPSRRAVFAGKLDYPRYGALDRLMIRLIMLLTHGPTDPTAVVEFTDWERVDTFSETIDRM